jgi:hypothetical protein
MQKSIRKHKYKSDKSSDHIIPHTFEEVQTTPKEKIHTVMSLMVYLSIIYLVFYTFNPRFLANGFYLLTILLTFALFYYIKFNMQSKRSK